MDFGGLESSPKISVQSNSGQQQSFNRQPIVLGTINSAAQNTIQRQPVAGAVGNNINNSAGGRKRRKRSLAPNNKKGEQQRQREQEFEAYASKYNENDSHNNDGEADEDLDDDSSYPLSVVSTDGQPLSNKRFRGLSRAGQFSSENSDDRQHETSESQMAQPSQRAPSHVDHDHHLQVDPAKRGHNLRGEKSMNNNDRQQQRQREPDRVRSNSLLEKQEKKKMSKPNSAAQQNYGNNIGEKRRGKHQLRPTEMTAAGSDLMSKLLGTASTNDESEMDVDLDDDDEANERRKEELDDAEFGIVNDHSQGGDSGGHSSEPVSGQQGRSRVDNQAANVDNDEATRNGGSASAAGESTTYGGGNSQRRAHQGGSGGGSTGGTRSDIEFYGHPGEETRQLKYGILGSGNYEVVNGGIYPEADESTAAVNSVANYVRKPGGLLAKMPSLAHQAGAFMPGGRIGGFLRGSASSTDGGGLANPRDIADLAAALMPTAPGDPRGDDLTGPLLHLLDATGDGAGEGNYLHGMPLISQLSSGSSSRTTHASKDDRDADSGDGRASAKLHHQAHSSLLRQNGRKKPAGQMNEIESHNRNEDDEDRRSAGQHHQLQQQQSSISGSRRVPNGSADGNQFNKYQILPSKKVTIYSEQDLDSAPSDRQQKRVARLQQPPAWFGPHQSDNTIVARLAKIR